MTFTNKDDVSEETRNHIFAAWDSLTHSTIRLGSGVISGYCAKDDMLIVPADGTLVLVKDRVSRVVVRRYYYSHGFSFKGDQSFVLYSGAPKAPKLADPAIKVDYHGVSNRVYLTPKGAPDTPFRMPLMKIKPHKFVSSIYSLFEPDAGFASGAEVKAQWPPPSKEDLNAFSDALKILGASGDFKIVSGSLIRKWYHYRCHASKGGSLGKSCMRGDAQQGYFSLYEDNPDTVSLAIVTNPVTKKLWARALLWTKNDKVYIDRIYDASSRHGSFLRSQVEDLPNFDGSVWRKDHYCKNMQLSLRIRASRPVPYMDSMRFQYAPRKFKWNPLVPEVLEVNPSMVRVRGKQLVYLANVPNLNLDDIKPKHAPPIYSGTADYLMTSTTGLKTNQQLYEDYSGNCYSAYEMVSTGPGSYVRWSNLRRTCLGDLARHTSCRLVGSGPYKGKLLLATQVAHIPLKGGTYWVPKKDTIPLLEAAEVPTTEETEETKGTEKT